MKDAMIVIAKFNQLQNQKLFALLDTLTDEQRKANVGTNYTFGSIHGALDRMAGTLGMSLNMLKDEGPGVPLYDMVMKGMFIANFVRGAICQALKAEYGISSDLISGALLS